MPHLRMGHPQPGHVRTFPAARANCSTFSEEEEDSSPPCWPPMEPLSRRIATGSCTLSPSWRPTTPWRSTSRRSPAIPWQGRRLAVERQGMAELQAQREASFIAHEAARRDMAEAHHQRMTEAHYRDREAQEMESGRRKVVTGAASPLLTSR